MAVHNIFCFLTTENIIVLLQIFGFRIKGTFRLRNFAAHFSKFTARYSSAAHRLGIPAVCSLVENYRRFRGVY
jgi:hypothetical protein